MTGAAQHTPEHPPSTPDERSYLAARGWDAIALGGLHALSVTALLAMLVPLIAMASSITQPADLTNNKLFRVLMIASPIGTFASSCLLWRLATPPPHTRLSASRLVLRGLAIVAFLLSLLPLVALAVVPVPPSKVSFNPIGMGETLGIFVCVLIVVDDLAGRLGDRRLRRSVIFAACVVPALFGVAGVIVALSIWKLSRGIIAMKGRGSGPLQLPDPASLDILLIAAGSCAALSAMFYGVWLIYAGRRLVAGSATSPAAAAADPRSPA